MYLCYRCEPIHFLVDLLAQIGGLKQQIADQTDFPNERFKMIKEMEQQRILHDREIQSLKLREVEQIGKIEAEVNEIPHLIDAQFYTNI